MVPILATAGVAGIAIGFGAQSLIKDYFNGFFLLLEDQLRQGDVVEIAGIDRWEPWGLVLRCRIPVLPHAQWSVRAEFLRRLKSAFEARGIQSP